MKRRTIAALLIAAVAACTIVGSVAAYMLKSAQEQSTPKVGSLSCSVPSRKSAATVAPEDTVVTNTSNTAAYLRIRLVEYWVDNSDARVYRATSGLTVEYDANKWWKDPNSDTYYYRSPITAAKATPALLTSAIPTQSETLDGKTIYRRIEILAEAIQAEPTDAVTEAWGVKLDKNGNIET